jgi:hypothetical protein
MLNFLLTCLLGLVHNVKDMASSWVGQDSLLVLLHYFICLTVFCVRTTLLIQEGTIYFHSMG